MDSGEATGSTGPVGQLAAHMRGLTALLDPAAGWYAEFLRRDPDGMRACLGGAAIPPWDVLQSLLHDLATLRGPQQAAREGAAAARLRAAAVTAYDQRHGSREELAEQLASVQAQQDAAQAAVDGLTAQLHAATGHARAEALTRELSWTHDDLARARSRRADLTARLADLTALETAARETAVRETAARERAVREGDAREAGAREGAAPDEVARQRALGGTGRRLLRVAGRSQGGARYAGAPGAAPAAPQPAAPAPDAAPAAAPRGARYAPVPDPVTGPAGAGARSGAGAGAGAGGGVGAGPDVWHEHGPGGGAGAPAAPAPPDRPPVPGPPDIAARVAELVGLRALGRTGEAHALLCDAAAWPPPLLPALAGQLERAGLGADWATLLWEAASLPPARLAAAAAALSEAGREADCGRLLRQGVARPAAEIADAALVLTAAGRDQEAGALLGAFVRARTAEESARLARQDPQRLAPRLLSAARGVSESRHRELVHALRVAGVTIG